MLEFRSCAGKYSSFMQATIFIRQKLNALIPTRLSLYVKTSIFALFYGWEETGIGLALCPVDEKYQISF